MFSDEILRRAERAAPFYYRYWDDVVTQNDQDATIGARNVVIEAILDLLCFAKRNDVDSDVVLAQVQKLFVDMKMQATLGTEDVASE